MKSITLPIPKIRNLYVMAADIVLVIAAVLGSYALRSELGDRFFAYLPSTFWMLLAALILKPLVYYFFGLYRRMWVYASTNELKLIIIAVSTASILVAVTMIILGTLRVYVGFPRAVLIIDWILSLMAVGGVRFTLRLLAETRSQHNTNASELPFGRSLRVLIVGAGDAGALVVRELQKNPQINLQPVGFLDDSPDKQRQQIYGVPVVGQLADLAHTLDTRKVDQVIIAIPSAPGKVMRLVADVCRLKGVPFRTMPGIYELLGGQVSVSRLREVDITDLLRRELAHIE